MRSFAWSPDMQHIAFVVNAEHWEDGPRPAEGIAVYSADGSRTEMHGTTGPREVIQRIWWTGEGQEVLYGSTLLGDDGAKQTIRALDPATGEIRELFPWSNSRVAYHLTADGSHALFLDVQAMLDEQVPPDSSRVGWVVTPRDGTGGRLVVPFWNSDGRAGQALFSPLGDRLLFTRNQNTAATVTGQAGSEPGTLWVVSTDGTGLRKVAAAHRMQSTVWDPSGRFIAYTASVDNAHNVLRIVDVAAGAQTDVPMPDGVSAEFVTDWSRDGRFIGLTADASRYEFWTIEGLLDAVR